MVSIGFFCYFSVKYFGNLKKWIDAKCWGGGFIKYLWIGTFVWIMLSESAVCHYNGTVHSAQL